MNKPGPRKKVKIESERQKEVQRIGDMELQELQCPYFRRTPWWWWWWWRQNFRVVPKRNSVLRKFRLTVGSDRRTL